MGEAPVSPVAGRLGATGEVAGPGPRHGEEIREARALEAHIRARPRRKLLLQRLPACAADLYPGQRPGHGVIARVEDEDVQSVLGLPGFEPGVGDALDRSLAHIHLYD